MHTPSQHWPFLTRRELLALGGVAALDGLRLPAATKPRARSCIFVFLFGGPSHIDLWDMKPDAPAEVRGPFRPIATSVPGVRVCEHLPRSARVMHHLVRGYASRVTQIVTRNLISSRGQP